jgi:hypothetical protein
MREWLRKILGKGVASRPLGLPGQARKVHILSAAERDAIVAAHLIRHLPALGLSLTGLPVLHQQRLRKTPKIRKGRGRPVTVTIPRTAPIAALGWMGRCGRQQVGTIAPAPHGIEFKTDRRTKPQGVDTVVINHVIGQRMNQNVKAIAVEH